MKIKTATELAIAGLIFTLLYKTTYPLLSDLFPDQFLKNSLGFVWILASLTIIVFCVVFLRYFKPANISLKIVLFGIILCTSLTILLHAEFRIFDIDYAYRNTTFGIISKLNSLFVLGFLWYFQKAVRESLAIIYKVAQITFWVHLFSIFAYIVLIIVRYLYMRNFEIDLPNPVTRSVILSIFVLDSIVLIWLLSTLRSTYWSINNVFKK